MKVELAPLDPHTASDAELAEYHRVRVADGNPDDRDFVALVARSSASPTPGSPRTRTPTWPWPR